MFAAEVDGGIALQPLALNMADATLGEGGAPKAEEKRFSTTAWEKKRQIFTFCGTAIVKRGGKINMVRNFGDKGFPLS